MKEYNTPDINITYFSKEDIVTTSVAPDYTEGLKNTVLSQGNLANINYNDIEFTF